MLIILDNERRQVMFKKIKIWYRAIFLDYPYWRVTYKTGERTRLLYWREANGLKEVFKGKLRIDYTVLKGTDK